MNVLPFILALILTSSSAFSQLCSDSIEYNILSKVLQEEILNTNVKSVLNESFRYQQNEESLVFYNTRNEILKFLFNDKGICKGYYILWLYEMIETSSDEGPSWGGIKNYCVNLSEQELNEIRGFNYNQLLELADTNIFMNNLDTTYLDKIAIPYHHGQFGVIYKSKTCDIEYFETDSLLTVLDEFFQKKLNTNSKQKKILKSLDFKFYSFGGCSYTYYQNIFHRMYYKIFWR